MRAVWCMAVLVAVMGLGFGCGKVKEAVGAKPTVPESWTHKELLEHLESKGAKIRSIPTNRASAYGPTVWIVAQDRPYTTDKEASEAYEKNMPGLIFCQLKKSPQEAKDDAGAKPATRIARGRFVFGGDPDLVEEIRKHLD